MKTSWLRFAIELVSLASVSLGVLACGEDEEGAPPTPVETEKVSPTGDVLPTATLGPTATTAIETAIPTPSAELMTFTNNKYGFAFDYPANWLVNPIPSSTDPTMSDYVSIYNHPPPTTGSGQIPPPEKVKIEFYILPNAEGLDLEQWAADFNSNPDGPVEVADSQSVSVGGKSALKQVVTPVGLTASFFEVFIAIDGRVLFINGPRADTPFVASYEAILQSLRID